MFIINQVWNAVILSLYVFNRCLMFIINPLFMCKKCFDWFLISYVCVCVCWVRARSFQLSPSFQCFVPFLESMTYSVEYSYLLIYKCPLLYKSIPNSFSTLFFKIHKQNLVFLFFKMTFIESQTSTFLF